MQIWIHGAVLNYGRIFQIDKYSALEHTKFYCGYYQQQGKQA